MFGMRLMPSPFLTETAEDWSEVRSPSRASRRRRQGHPQRIRPVQRASPQVIVFGDAIHAHPDILARIAAEVPLRPEALRPALGGGRA